MEERKIKKNFYKFIVNEQNLEASFNDVFVL